MSHRPTNSFPHRYHPSSNSLPRVTTSHLAPMFWVRPAALACSLPAHAAVGHFYLTKLLLPTLSTTASPGKPARVINTSSIASEINGPDINYNTLKDSPARKKMGVNKLYAQSKFVRGCLSERTLRISNADIRLGRRMSCSVTSSSADTGTRASSPLR
jgi:hypothetical protein